MLKKHKNFVKIFTVAAMLATMGLGVSATKNGENKKVETSSKTETKVTEKKKAKDEKNKLEDSKENSDGEADKKNKSADKSESKKKKNKAKSEVSGDLTTEKNKKNSKDEKKTAKKENNKKNIVVTKKVKKIKDKPVADGKELEKTKSKKKADDLLSIIKFPKANGVSTYGLSARILGNCFIQAVIDKFMAFYEKKLKDYENGPGKSGKKAQKVEMYTADEVLEKFHEIIVKAGVDKLKDEKGDLGKMLTFNINFGKKDYVEGNEKERQFLIIANEFGEKISFVNKKGKLCVKKYIIDLSKKLLKENFGPIKKKLEKDYPKTKNAVKKEDVEKLFQNLTEVEVKDLWKI